MNQEGNTKINLLLAKAASDPAFLKQLEDPHQAPAILKKHGITLPEGVKLQIIQEPENTKILVVPNSAYFKKLAGGVMPYETTTETECNLLSIVNLSSFM